MSAGDAGDDMVTLRTKVRLRGEGMTTCGEFTCARPDGELYVDNLRRWIRLRGSFRRKGAGEDARGLEAMEQAEQV